MFHFKIHSLSDMREGSIDSPWISVNEQTSTHYHAFIQSWHGQSPCSYVIMWSLRLTSQSLSPSPSSGSDSENTSYAWFEWDAIIDLDCKFANTSNLQICQTQLLLVSNSIVEQGCEVIACWQLHWEKVGEIEYRSLFLPFFPLSFLNRSFSAVFVGGKPIYSILVAKIIISAAQSS